MSRAGYGRGYYGAGQLAPSAPPRRRSWFTIVAVLGVGAAAVWFLWPRGSTPDFKYGGKEPEPPTPPSPLTPSTLHSTIAPALQITVTSAPATVTSAPLVVGAFLKQLEDDALLRGYPSVKEYEDSVIAIAKQLEATGAKVMLAPHLQHLAPRLGSPAS